MSDERQPRLAAITGRKGGGRPTALERFAVQVAAVLAQMGEVEDGPLRVTLYLLVQEYHAGMAGVAMPMGQIADGAGISRGRARRALENLQAEGWAEPVGRASWRLLPIAPYRE